MLAALLIAQIIQAPLAEAVEMVRVPKGIYQPFFRDQGEIDQNVGPLEVDRLPVTNADFLQFVRKHPSWRRSQVKPLFASAGYLASWHSDLTLDTKSLSHPTTEVSWFAAREYCASLGKRLMSTAEWEYVADAANPSNQELILKWYAEPADLANVEKSVENKFHLRGMHGLIWEWVEDFSSAIISGDSRSASENDRGLFCGAGALKSKDPAQYATYMRFAHRSSLSASSVGRALGFRCARNSPPTHPHPKLTRVKE